jgi:hypothetical protein
MWQGLVRMIPIDFERYKHFGLVILPKAERISHLTGTGIPLSTLKMDPKKLWSEDLPYLPGQTKTTF